jgi:acetyltransferase-like isoleucine patch superfamily enzyme
VNRGKAIDGDWYPGKIPPNVNLDDTAYCETTFSFHLFRSQLPLAITYGRGSSTYLGTMFDVGAQGRVKIGDYALVHGARIICDSEIYIGDYALISWNVVLMDTYRLSMVRSERRKELKLVPTRVPRVMEGNVSAKPIHIERNVWLGFEACVLPGVTIGEGSVIGAKSVVSDDVPPFTVVAGNPARVIRRLVSAKNAPRVI